MTYETAMLIECWVVVILGIALILLIIFWIVSAAFENYMDWKRVKQITHSKEFELQTERKIEELITQTKLISQRLNRLEHEKNDKK